jgi:hypothetical protein
VFLRRDENVLGDDKRQQVLALGRLGWSLRRIEEATEVRRETASAYLKAAGIVVPAGAGRAVGSRPAIPGVSTDPGPSKPAICQGGVHRLLRGKPVISSEGSTDSEPPARPLAPGRAPGASACEPFRDVIAEALIRGRNAVAIWQDLVDRHGFGAGYASVRRFLLKLRGSAPAEARVVITTAPGEEAQDDYGARPMVRHPDS